MSLDTNPNPPRNTPGRVTINVWQAHALAEAMEAHDDPKDETLNAAYATVELREIEGDRVLFVRWDDGHRLALWHDGSDVTADFPEEVER